MKKFFETTIVNILVLTVFISAVAAAPVVRQGSGASPAALQAIVDQFRADPAREKACKNESTLLRQVQSGIRFCWPLRRCPVV